MATRAAPAAYVGAIANQTTKAGRNACLTGILPTTRIRPPNLCILRSALRILHSPHRRLRTPATASETSPSPSLRARRRSRS
jgi:hypothetical protein